MSEPTITELMQAHNAAIRNAAVKWEKQQKPKHGPKASPNFKSVYITKHHDKVDYFK